MELNSFDNRPFNDLLGHDTHYNIKKQLLKFKGLTEFFQFAFEIYIACQDLTVGPLDLCAREKANKIGMGEKSLLKKFGNISRLLLLVPAELHCHIFQPVFQGEATYMTYFYGQIFQHKRGYFERKEFAFTGTVFPLSVYLH